MNVQELLELCMIHGISIHFGHDKISYWIELRKGGWANRYFIKPDMLYAVPAIDYQIMSMIQELQEKGEEK